MKEIEASLTHYVTKEGCQIIGGTSGSPVISVETGEVVAVNNTMAEGSGAPCSVNNPCELEDNQRTMHKGHGYGQQVVQLYRCLDDNFFLDIDEDCLL